MKINLIYKFLKPNIIKTFNHFALHPFLSKNTGEELYMSVDMRNKLAIDNIRLDEVNAFLMDPNNKIVNELLKVVEKYGGPDEINRKAKEAGNLEKLMSRLKEKNSPYVKDLEWLIEQRDKGAFITVDDYRK